LLQKLNHLDVDNYYTQGLKSVKPYSWINI